MSSFIFGIVGYLVWYVTVLKKENLTLYRRLVKSDQNIKTLHGNQKRLHSAVKELNRELRHYGKIKTTHLKEDFVD